ncbi:MAG: hypothetical protein RAO92_06595 [Candidatus Euphemobacter frigidus]|nr:hypothetical protein [Candidatus Euphemobacter frigidus]MDP8276055.1 hypothetical protein [Candidatus Euphemobacter frigidus]
MAPEAATGASKSVEKAVGKGQEVAKRYLTGAVKATTGLVYSGLYYGSYYGTLGVLGASDLVSGTFIAEAVREGVNDARQQRGKGGRKKGKR